MTTINNYNQVTAMKNTIRTKLYPFLLCLLVSTTYGISQNAQLNWSAESDVVSINGVEAHIASILEKAGDTLTWKQLTNGQTEINTFEINNVSGSWDLPTDSGALNYDLSIEGASSTLELQHSDGEDFSFTITIFGYNPQGDQYAFHINNLTYQ